MTGHTSATATPVAPPAGAASSVERAIVYIREAIIDGTLPADSMLSEGDLADHLGVSRTPVRVALARLQDEGWIRIYPKRGALVLGFAPDELADLSDARLVLEISGVTRASPDVRLRLADELAASVALQREAFADDDIARFIDLTLEFHASFLRAGANQFLMDLGARLSNRQRQVLFAQQDALRARSEHIIAEHQQLLDCLGNDDVDGFVRVMRAHVASTVDDELGPV